MSAHRYWRAAGRKTARDGPGSASYRADRAGPRCPFCRATTANARGVPMAQAAAPEAADPGGWLLRVLLSAVISTLPRLLSEWASLQPVVRPALLQRGGFFAVALSVFGRSSTTRGHP